MKRRWFVATLIMLLFASTVSGQERSGRLRGRVLDADGSPIPGVTVGVSGSSLPVPLRASTDERGMFRFVGLPVGRYRVELTRIGLRAVSHADVAILLGSTTSLGDTRMDIEAVPLEPLVIEGAAFVVDATTTAATSNIQASLFETLPTDRDFKSIIQLLPGANASFLGDPVNISGSTGLENMYYVEGANVTDVFRGRTGTDLPYNFIEAIEVKQGGYEAEYGQALGGLINVTTRSGTNEFKAEAFGFLSGSAFAADPKPVPHLQDVDSFSDYDVGVGLSGPLVRDRAWYFAAYNPSFRRSDVILPGFRPQDASVTKHMFAGKLSWRPSATTDLDLSVFGDPTTLNTVDPPQGGTLLNVEPALAFRREGGLNVSLNARSWLGSRVLLEGLVAHHQRDEVARGATEAGLEPEFTDLRDPADPLVSGGFLDDTDYASRRTSAKITGTLFAGPHEVKLGVFYDETELHAQYRRDPVIQQFADDDYRAAYFILDATARNRAPGFFLQDSWSVTDRLRINAGLRWDGVNLASDEGGVRQPIGDQWQPRLGFVFEPGERGTEKIVGSFARFYQQPALFMPVFFYNPFDARIHFSSVDPRLDPTSVDSVFVIQDPANIPVSRVDDLQGEHLDEFALGYERLVGEGFKLSARGVYRTLRTNWELMLGVDPTTLSGNRGKGQLSHVPEPTRTYTALELSARHESPRLMLLGSYVLSRSYGDYPGLFASESGGLVDGSTGPNNNQTLYVPAQIVNAKGLLPNDRTHAFKLSASYRVGSGLTAGTFFTVQSGTPLNEFGWVPSGFLTPLFLVERGSAGRTPAIWDLNLRFVYQPEGQLLGGRLILDLLHLGNPQGVTNRDQRRFFSSSLPPAAAPAASWSEIAETQVGENERFGQPTAFQPPFTVRLGFEIGLSR